MRISVLAGLFACAVIFARSTTPASAATQEILSNTSTETTVVQLLSMEQDFPLAVLEAGEVPVKNKEKEVQKHTVLEHETLSDVAKKYDTDWERIFYKNKTITHPDIIKVGMKLVIPQKDEKLTKRELPIAPVMKINKTTTSPKSYTAYSSNSSGNGYVAGYCTWHVKNRRPDLPNNLGNAYSWVYNASAQGIPTGSTPRAGAVGQRANHVVYVESVNKDGTVTISEMNYRSLFAKTTRTLPANHFSYIY